MSVPVPVVSSDLVPVVGGLKSSSKGVYFSDIELRDVGCRNCVLKSHGQCPRGFSGVDFLPVGYCHDLVHFLLGFCSVGDSSSAVWEKFHIYKVRLQENEEYTAFLDLQKQIKSLELSLGLNPSSVGVTSELLSKLVSDRNSAKLWWYKLNQQTILSLQKVVDRESKRDVGVKPAGIFSSGTINFNVNNAGRALSDVNGRELKPLGSPSVYRGLSTKDARLNENVVQEK